MKKIFKSLSVLFVLSLLCLTMSTTIFASTTKPYDLYGVVYYNSQYTFSYINKCSCTPVDNYLYASCTGYYTTASGSYVSTNTLTSSGYNVDEQKVQQYLSGTDSFYGVAGTFKARCGSGSTYTYTKSYFI